MMKCLLNKFATIVRNSKEQYENIDSRVRLVLDDNTENIYLYFDNYSRHIHFNEGLVNRIFGNPDNKYYLDDNYELYIDSDFIKEFIDESIDVLRNNNIDYKKVSIHKNFYELVYGGF